MSVVTTWVLIAIVASAGAAEAPLERARHGALYARLDAAAAVLLESAGAAPAEHRIDLTKGGRSWLWRAGVYDMDVEPMLGPAAALAELARGRLAGRGFNASGMAVGADGRAAAVVVRHLVDVTPAARCEAGADGLLRVSVAPLAGVTLSRALAETADGRFVELKRRRLGPGLYEIAGAAAALAGARVEVMVQGAGGPVPAAMFPMCGAAEGGAARPVFAAPVAAGGAAARDVAAHVRRATDAARADRGLPPLAQDRRLDAVAQRHADALARRGRLLHVTPELGALPDRLLDAGVGFDVAVENLVAAPDATSAMARLRDSPAHARNLFVDGDHRAGVGVARGNVGGAATLFVVQVFARVRGGAAPAATARRVVDALNGARRARGRTAVERLPILDWVARRAARGIARSGATQVDDATWRGIADALRDAGVDAGRVEVAVRRGEDATAAVAADAVLHEPGMTHAGAGLAAGRDVMVVVCVAIER
jgi:uncharacterized protein YkwD